MWPCVRRHQGSKALLLTVLEPGSGNAQLVSLANLNPIQPPMKLQCGDGKHQGMGLAVLTPRCPWPSKDPNPVWTELCKELVTCWAPGASQDVKSSLP